MKYKLYLTVFLFLLAFFVQIKLQSSESNNLISDAEVNRRKNGINKLLNYYQEEIGLNLTIFIRTSQDTFKSIGRLNDFLDSWFSNAINKQLPSIDLSISCKRLKAIISKIFEIEFNLLATQVNEGYTEYVSQERYSDLKDFTEYIIAMLVIRNDCNQDVQEIIDNIRTNNIKLGILFQGMLKGYIAQINSKTRWQIFGISNSLLIKVACLLKKSHKLEYFSGRIENTLNEFLADKSKIDNIKTKLIQKIESCDQSWYKRYWKYIFGASMLGGAGVYYWYKKKKK